MTIRYLLYTSSTRTTGNVIGMIINLVSSLVVDHLVNNAGVANVCWFEEVADVADFKQVLVRFSSSCAALFCDYVFISTQFQIPLMKVLDV